MLKDLEINDGSYSTEYRQLDTRIGRWLSVDPKAKQMPWQSPYISMDNNPIANIDPNGDCPNCISGAIAGALLDIVFQVGEHMLVGDDINTAIGKINWTDVGSAAILGAAMGFFTAGAEKLVELAKPKNRKILEAILDLGLEQLENVLANWIDFNKITEYVHETILGNKPKITPGDAEHIARQSLKQDLEKDYPSSQGYKIIGDDGEIYGKFDKPNNSSGTHFDYVVIDKNGDIVEVAESKGKLSSTSNQKTDLSKSQKSFYYGENNVTLSGKWADQHKLTGKRINPNTVKTRIKITRVNVYTGKTTEIDMDGKKIKTDKKRNKGKLEGTKNAPIEPRAFSQKQRE